MKVSIIIVSWNGRELLRKCLASLELYQPPFPIEVIVVDNGSADNTPGMIRERFTSVKLIVNPDNRGFAAACNQGIAMSSGEYCFFLNPDAEVTAGAIETLVRMLDTNAAIAIAAPKILNADGSPQESIEPFPTPYSQLLRFFKLSHFQKKRLLQNDGIQDVDQPMGAALMIRRSTLAELGNFDEHFFIWFEEVDLCKRVKDTGYRIVYQPAAVVTHQRGTSFVQHDLLRKQVMFYTSCRQYLEKHFGWRAWYASIPMRLFTGSVGLYVSPFSGRRADVWNAHRYIVMRTCALLMLVGAISFVGYFFAAVRSLGFLIIVLAAFGISMIRLEYGMWFVFAELIIGSKGHLFSLPISDEASLSIRMGLFVAVLSAWAVTLLRSRLHGSAHSFFAFSRSRFFPFAVLVAAFYLYGVVRGLIANDRALALSDANGWLFLLLILPLYDSIRSREQILRLLAVLAGAFAAQIAAAFSILYVMSHKGFGLDIQYSLYRWVRTTGFGEITQMSDQFFRIFLQSQIYAVSALFILAAYLFVAMRSRTTGAPLKLGRIFWIFSAVTIASLILSLSRSFAVAIAAVGIVIIGVLLTEKDRIRVAWAMAWRGIAASIFALAVISAVAFFPLPSGESGIGFDVLAQRFEDLDSEAAARSRWELLPALQTAITAHPFAGYGFGKTVTYQSSDPRVLETNPTGTYTTYAFEWGYLDLWVKLGLFGLLAIAALLFQILSVGWRACRAMPLSRVREHALLFGLWLGVVALLVVHIFTPYIVHPLGIGILMLSMLCCERLSTFSDTH